MLTKGAGGGWHVVVMGIVSADSKTMRAPICPSATPLASWFQLLVGNTAGGNVSLTGDEAYSPFAPANPLTLDTARFVRYDPTVHAPYGPLIAPPNTVCLADTSLGQNAAWPGDELQATDTGHTEKMVTATGLPPASGHENDSGVATYEVWEIVNRASAQLSYVAKMGDPANNFVGVLGWDSTNSSWNSWQYCQVTINGVNYQKIVHAGTLLAPTGAIFGGEDCRVTYDPDDGCFYVTASPCYASS